MNNFLYKNILIGFIIALISIPQILFAYTSPLYPVSISAVVVSTPTPSGGGGGGGGSGIPLTIPTTINFSGMAYPLSKVYITKDSSIVATTIADQAANFSVSLSGLTTNTYTFSVYGEDSENRKSSFFSFPIYITEGTTVNIGNIYLSPTIDIDKIQVKRGDNLAIFGRSTPQSEIVISVNSKEERFYSVVSNKIGAYLYNLDTSILELGQHQTKSKSKLLNQVSLYTVVVPFSVGLENKLKKNIDCSYLRGDLNCDNYVNLIDFSIMAYWYRKDNPPSIVDLNNDSKISLIDFSIMAFNWTG